MTSPLAQPAHRPLRILLDVVLRAGGLIAGVAIMTSLSAGNDALEDGLNVMVGLVAIAFAAALLDGLLQRDRVRLYLVWAFVVPIVGLLETADYVRTNLTGPGAYTSLAGIGLGDIGQTYLFYALLVGPPAAVGILLGVLIRPRAATPRPTAAAPATNEPLPH